MLNAHANSILVVEDEVPLAMWLVSELRSFGYQAEFKTRGQAALDWVKDNPVNLALLDIGLPGMSGIALASRLREEHNLRCVFITKSNDEQTFRDAQQSCPLDYLVKPVSTESLREAIEWALLDLASIEFELQYLVPNVDDWMTTPHERLRGKSPREVIGTPQELELRKMLRAVIQGMPT